MFLYNFISFSEFADSSWMNLGVQLNDDIEHVGWRTEVLFFHLCPPLGLSCFLVSTYFTFIMHVFCGKEHKLIRAAFKDSDYFFYFAILIHE